ncbi:GT2 family glycosyltransferase [Rhodoplanes tepidamans]|uniref:Glycosyltransferase n=2 Tax=Rhodoplanes TaxID=29407 RepID=A0ABT5JCT5_RHOTP|nr:glycosyltransferase [Rhodoplanes tepidamans]MDC7787421.1 glycosyltransferase [Rhodoplanes tepidamans]MDQ0358093.1 GT2 family glycosyltransferase [Rhodoplanes tepidamans]
MRAFSHDLRRALDILRTAGLVALAQRAGRRLRRLLAPRGYAAWIRRYGTGLPDPRLSAPRADGGRSIAVLLPEPGVPDDLAATLRALQAQTSPAWRLRIAVAGPPPAALVRLAAAEPRVDLVPVAPPERAEDAWAAAATALAAGAAAPLVTVLDAGDRPAPDMVAAAQAAFADDPGLALAFGDEDVLRPSRLPWRGPVRADPWFKPDWNPALMLGCDAVGRPAVHDRATVLRLGGFRPGLAGAEEHDLALRIARAVPPAAIRHLPRVLLHRRPGGRHPGGWRMPEGGAAARRAVAEHLAALDVAATVEPGPVGNRVATALPRPAPRVSVLVATTGRPAVARRCFETLLRATDYDPLEVLVLVAEPALADPERASFLNGLAADPRVRLVVGPDRPFNYSEVNNHGAAQATGEFLCFLNDDTEALGPGWLAALAARTMLPEVGAAGAMLYYPDGTIQHAGVLLGLGGIAGHAGHRVPRGSPGPFGRFALDQDVAAVTAACMAVRADVFRDVGGFDEALPLAYNDVDLCLRIRRAGWRILWTPAAALVHHESASLGPHDTAHAARFAEDVRLMRERWAEDLAADPYYNANLSLDRAWALAFPPRPARPTRTR